MKVPSDYADKALASARSIERDVIAQLLTSLGPRKQEVSSLSLLMDRTHPDNPAYAQLSGRRGRRTAPQTKLRRKSVRVRGRNKHYTVNAPRAHCNHRAGTWRHAMVHAVVSSDNECAALDFLAENYPDLASKGVDINWCAKQGYITL